MSVVLVKDVFETVCTAVLTLYIRVQRRRVCQTVQR